MASIFDIVTAQQLAAYWNGIGQTETYMTQELFPNAKQLGLNLKWIKGARGRSIVLKASAFDAQAIPRPRIGFTQMLEEMPFFKESSYISEELRQQFNMILMSNNQAYIDSAAARVFDDEMRLIRAAAQRREQIRAMLISTGTIAFKSNGQDFTFDYGIKPEHKITVETAWEDTDADILEDIRQGKETIQSDTGDVIARAICDGLTWKNLRNNESIRKSIFAFNAGTGGILSDRILKTFILDELGIDVLVNDLKYTEEDGTSVRYVPENTFAMFPAGQLGNTWFGTTPAESDLMSMSSANVAVVDTGVAIMTEKITDPVQVNTIVSQICLPSFERAESLYILNTSV